MLFPILLAHGIFGPNDEVIFPVVGGAFIGLLIITWLSARQASPSDTPDDPAEPPPPVPDNDPSHFKLD